MKKAKKSFQKWAAKLKKREWAERKYGEMSHVTKRKMMEGNAAKLRSNMTAPERKMENFLKEMNVNHETQTILGSFIYDFCLPDHKVLIEVDGDYFHGHPDKYAKEDLNALQRKIKRNDLLKDKMASGMKYTLLRFWECDIHENESMVKKAIKKHIDGLES